MISWVKWCHSVNSLACVAGGIREWASERRTRHIPSRSSRGNLRATPPILSRLRHSCSRLLYQNKSTRARNPASYAGYEFAWPNTAQQPIVTVTLFCFLTQVTYYCPQWFFPMCDLWNCANCTLFIRFRSISREAFVTEEDLFRRISQLRLKQGTFTTKASSLKNLASTVLSALQGNCPITESCDGGIVSNMMTRGVFAWQPMGSIKSLSESRYCVS